MCLETKSPFDFNNLADLLTYFKDEKTCLNYIEQWRWKGDVRCEDCGHNKIYRFAKRNRFKCANCKGYFTVTSRTIFDNTKLPLIKWMMALYFVSNHKRGISSCQLASDLGITQKSAWHILHKIRTVLAQANVKLEGVVSSDEAFVGGKNSNRHKSKRMAYSTGRNYKDKAPVLGMMEKNGKVKTIVMPSVAGKNIRQGVLQSVIPGSTLITDEYHAYKRMKRYYIHEVVQHWKGQYINQNGFSSNNIEGFWSHLKRMIIGVYYSVSHRHLQKYCDELTFRFNMRKEKESVRFVTLFDRLRTKITYKQLAHASI